MIKDVEKVKNKELSTIEVIDKKTLLYDLVFVHGILNETVLRKIID